MLFLRAHWRPVVCCDGRKVACNWIWEPDNPTDDVIEDIIEKCVTKHELDHFDRTKDCPKQCPHLDRGKTKPGTNVNKEECQAYKKELACLRSTRGRCRRIRSRTGRQKCFDRIDSEIAFVRGQIAARGPC